MNIIFNKKDAENLAANRTTEWNKKAPVELTKVKKKKVILHIAMYAVNVLWLAMFACFNLFFRETADNPTTFPITMVACLGLVMLTTIAFLGEINENFDDIEYYSKNYNEHKIHDINVPLAERLLDLYQENYEIIKLYAVDPSVRCYSIHAHCADESGNVQDKYIGIAKIVYNKNTNDVTLNVNEEKIYIPYDCMANKCITTFSWTPETASVPA